MKHTRLPEQKCENCGYEMDCATGAFGDRTPKPKDITLCLNCGEAYEFNDDLTHRRLSQDDVKELPFDLQTQLMQVRLGIMRVKVGRN